MACSKCGTILFTSIQYMCKVKWKVVYASFSEMDTDVYQNFETTGSLPDNCIQTDEIPNIEVKH